MLHFATLLAAATLLAIDLTKSTSDNYASPSAPLREEYLQSRARLDYGWHVKYSLERQAVQDSIVASILSAVGKSPPPPVQPWVVFTAGCMGAVRSIDVVQVSGLKSLSFLRRESIRIRDLVACW